MRYDIHSKQYQADRASFNSIHKASGNGSFVSMRQAELEVAAKGGNLYARHQLQNQGQADVAIFSDQARAAQQEAHAYGVAADVTEKIADNVTGGAQRDLRTAYESGSLQPVLAAGGKVALSAVTAFVTDKAVGAVVGEGAALLQGTGRAPLRTAGSLLEKYGEKLVGWENDYEDYVKPMVDAVV